MKNEELKEAIAKYIESKELVLMGYSPEYIDDVKTDMEMAFCAGVKWMAEQYENHLAHPTGCWLADDGYWYTDHLVMKDSIKIGNEPRLFDIYIRKK